MRVAMLAPIARRTPPRHYGSRERVVSLLTEGLVKRGVDVTLFATQDSQTTGQLVGVCPRGYEEDADILPKVWEGLHISALFECGDSFDLIHNHCGYAPLTYTGMTSTPVVTTMHGFPSPQMLPVYEKYNQHAYYVAISHADRRPELDYVATIHHGIDLSQYTFTPDPGDYLLFCGRLHPDTGAKDALEMARKVGQQLVITGSVQDTAYFEREVQPHLDGKTVIYIDSPSFEKRNALLARAYALLHPSKVDASYGLSVIEAMACGTPVIAYKRGSMPEVIAHGRSGFLVPSVEEASQALQDLTQLHREECRQWVEERFHADHMVENYLHVYETIISQRPREDHRPWGYYRVLVDEPDHKVKSIVVSPGQRLSLQRHHRRAEHWYIVQGRANAVRNGKDIPLETGQAIDIPQGTWHRITNPGHQPLIFIEVQTGDYFGEDDIERAEDDYGRLA